MARGSRKRAASPASSPRWRRPGRPVSLVGAHPGISAPVRFATSRRDSGGSRPQSDDRPGRAGDRHGACRRELQLYLGIPHPAVGPIVRHRHGSRPLPGVSGRERGSAQRGGQGRGMAKDATITASQIAGVGDAGVFKFESRTFNATGEALFVTEGGPPVGPIPWRGCGRKRQGHRC